MNKKSKNSTKPKNPEILTIFNAVNTGLISLSSIWTSLQSWIYYKRFYVQNTYSVLRTVEDYVEKNGIEVMSQIDSDGSTVMHWVYTNT